MRPLLIIALVIILLFVGKQYVFNRGSASPSAGSSQSRVSTGVLPVDIFIAEPVLIENTVYASGTVTPNEEVSIQSEISGRLIRLNIREGSYIKRGALIAKIDDSDLRAQMKKLNYEEKLAEQIEARQRKLLDIDAISKEEYDIAVNRVNTLSADKELLKVQLAKTEVLAPFDGYIGLKNISIGTYLTPGVVIAELVQTHPLKIDFNIPEKYIGQVEIGQEVSFVVDGIDDQFSAKVMALDPKVDEDLRTLRLRAITPNPDRRLLPGMFVRLTVPLGHQESIVVPTDCIVPILKGKMVYVKEKGVARGVEITTGVRDDENIQVLTGLQRGDSVIVSALMSMKDGISIQAKEITHQSLDQ